MMLPWSKPPARAIITGLMPSRGFVRASSHLRHSSPCGRKSGWAVVNRAVWRKSTPSRRAKKSNTSRQIEFVRAGNSTIVPVDDRGRFQLRRQFPHGAHTATGVLLAEHQPIHAGFEHALDGFVEQMGRGGNVRRKDQAAPASRVAQAANDLERFARPRNHGTIGQSGKKVFILLDE